MLRLVIFAAVLHCGICQQYNKVAPGVPPQNYQQQVKRSPNTFIYKIEFIKWLTQHIAPKVRATNEVRRKIYELKCI